MRDFRFSLSLVSLFQPLHDLPLLVFSGGYMRVRPRRNDIKCESVNF
jgi:hypothetical protein